MLDPNYLDPQRQTPVQRMTTELLAHETAERWIATDRTCPKCYAKIYQHAALASIGQGYSRCAACRQSYSSYNSMLRKDVLANQLLDELAHRLPSILGERENEMADQE